MVGTLYQGLFVFANDFPAPVLELRLRTDEASLDLEAQPKERVFPALLFVGPRQVRSMSRSYRIIGESSRLARPNQSPDFSGGDL